MDDAERVQCRQQIKALLETFTKWPIEPWQSRMLERMDEAGLLQPRQDQEKEQTR